MAKVCLQSHEFSAVTDDHFLRGFATLRAAQLNPLHHFHALHYLSEHHVLVVQPLGAGRRYEELGSVRIGSGVGHR